MDLFGRTELNSSPDRGRSAQAEARFAGRVNVRDDTAMKRIKLCNREKLRVE